MTLTIRTTGIEQFLPGTAGKLRFLLLGLPGSGKTSFASYAPKPIYADADGGLSAVADRHVDFGSIQSSGDMNDLLEKLRQECRKPWAQRRWHTLVIDTIDSYQRVCKEEYLRTHRGLEAFSGRDAWNFLDAKMQQLLTRLLLLDMNILVAAHFKMVGGDEDAGNREMALLLQGAVKDSIWGDFDLIGLIGTYYETVDGERVRKRGITFSPTPERPFLRDRLRIAPDWLPVTFSHDDWDALFASYIKRAETLEPGAVVAEIGSEPVSPAVGEGGPVAAAPQAELPLTALDRPSLVSLARGLGLAVRGNSTKGDLIDAIAKYRALQEAENKIEAEQPPEGGEPSHDEAVATAVAELGAEVTSDYTMGQVVKVEEKKPETVQISETNGQLQCAEDGCGKVLGSGDASVTKSLMKEWPPLCEQHYGERKKAKV